VINAYLAWAQVTFDVAKILRGAPYALTGVPRLKVPFASSTPVVPRYAVTRRASSAQPASLLAYTHPPCPVLARVPDG